MTREEVLKTVTRPFSSISNLLIIREGNTSRPLCKPQTFWLFKLRERDFNNTELREKKLTKTVRPVKFNENFARSMVFEGPFAPAYYEHGTLTHTTSSNDYIETNWRTPSYVL